MKNGFTNVGVLRNRRWPHGLYFGAQCTHGIMKDEALTILRKVCLDIEKGEDLFLLGPSGSVKPLLNAMAGFELVTSSSITIDGEG